jgi:hypothetical protein
MATARPDRTVKIDFRVYFPPEVVDDADSRLGKEKIFQLSVTDANGKLGISLKSVTYGEYGGWGKYDPKYEKPPIDCLDMACYLHDLTCEHKNIGRVQRDYALQNAVRAMRKQGLLKSTGARVLSYTVTSWLFNFGSWVISFLP